LTCRLYPFGPTPDDKSIRFEKTCLGVGEGPKPDPKRAERIIRLNLNLFMKDKKLSDEYVETHHLTPIHDGQAMTHRQFSSLDDATRAILSEKYDGLSVRAPSSMLRLYRKLIDPYAALGVVPLSKAVEEYAIMYEEMKAQSGL
jgi:hypothetical protein